MDPEIKLLNAEEGQVYEYPLVLLECEFQCAWEIPESVFAEVQVGETATFWPVAQSGKFKALVLLPHIGQHDIVLNVADCYHFLSVTYEPKQSLHKIRFYYQKCKDSDGTFDAPPSTDNSELVAIAKIKFNAMMMQTAMAELLRMHGFPRDTITLEGDENGHPIVHVVETSFTNEEARAVNDQELFAKVTKDIEAQGYSNDDQVQWKHAIILGCTHFNPETKKSEAHLALGGSSYAQFGSAGLHTWASHVGEVSKCFLDNTLIDRNLLLDDSCGRQTHWANYATGLGAFFHELGHSLGLGHSKRGIMSRGFDNMNRIFTVFEPKSNDFRPAFHHPYSDGKIFLNLDVIQEVNGAGEAVWHRASALKLRTSQWIDQNASLRSTIAPTINWRRDMLGPFGEGSYDGTQHPFGTDKGDVAGFLISSNVYVDEIEILTTSTLNDLLLADVSVSGNQDLFILLDGEYILRIDVHAVAWVDGIRFHTNLRTTRVFGGGQGIAPRSLVAPPGHYIHSLFGTRGDNHVGKVGAFVRPLPENVVIGNAQPLTTSASSILSTVASFFGPAAHTLAPVGQGAYDGVQDPFSYKDVGAAVITCTDYVTNFKCLSCTDYRAKFASGFFCASEEHVFELVSNEHLVQVDVRSGAWIDAVRFITNKRISPWFGGDGGNETSFVCPPNCSITGFHGSTGDNYVGTLGVYYTEDSAEATAPKPALEPKASEPLLECIVGVFIVASTTEIQLAKSFSNLDEYTALADEYGDNHVIFALNNPLVQVDVSKQPDGVIVGFCFHTTKGSSPCYGKVTSTLVNYLSAPNVHISTFELVDNALTYELQPLPSSGTHPQCPELPKVDLVQPSIELQSSTGIAFTVLCLTNNGDALVDRVLEWKSAAEDSTYPNAWYISYAQFRACLPEDGVMTDYTLEAVDCTGNAAKSPCISLYL
ncbi:hypothetical protein THRCLA_10354 [Thraustotheca clavata]|uniref:Jacalin-type lectin domain-containing protein n=1 Tax=Thraustotheca clavata TaxID=74557 RepID=A0A1V9YRU9_9STRA|nr:hypothetical protein THRCLA_10354 [Thraustotheca clavata]